RPLGGCGIEVHPGDSRLRKTLGHQTLELLGSRPPIAHGRTGADRTRKWNRCLIITVVTAEQVWVAVYGESNTAIGTLDRLTAFSTLQEGGPTPAVEKQQGLLPARQRGRQRLVQLLAPRQAGAIHLWCNPQVNQLHRWHRARCDALRQVDDPAGGRGGVPGLQ